MTVWEIFTCGRIPYAGVPAMNLLEALKEGQRLEEPDNEACFSEVLVIDSIDTQLNDCSYCALYFQVSGGFSVLADGQSKTS